MLEADRGDRANRSNEPTGEVESLVGRLTGTRMGDRVQRGLSRDELKRRREKAAKKAAAGDSLGFTADASGRQSKRQRKSGTQRAEQCSAIIPSRHRGVAHNYRSHLVQVAPL